MFKDSHRLPAVAGFEIPRLATADQRRVHEPSCGIWDIPPSFAVEHLLAHGIEGPAAATYLSAVTPLYAAAARIMAQLAGLLLLGTTSTTRGLPLDHPILASARAQMQEASDRQRALPAPASALRHRWAMTAIMEGLAAALLQIETTSATLDGHSRQEQVTQIARQLHLVQRLLVAAAVPNVGITPVDLSAACCSCGSAPLINAQLRGRQ